MNDDIVKHMQNENPYGIGEIPFGTVDEKHISAHRPALYANILKVVTSIILCFQDILNLK